MLLFDSEFRKRLEYLSIVSRRIFAGHFRAERRATRRGTGVEFADYRQYVPGDDFRHLDWKAYLRLNKLILRLFEEEEDLPIYFFIDASQSMAFGNPAKFDYARRVAAALCYIGLANLDRVYVMVYADRIRAELAPQPGKGRILKVFRFLEDVAAGGDTNARESFKTYCSGTRRRGLAVVISDFMDPAGFQSGLDVLRHFKHDIFALHVASHEEAEPTVTGELLLVDSESNSTREVTITPSLLADYRKEFADFSGSIEAYCSKYQLGYVRTVTDFPFEDLVMKVFRQGRFLK